jgi:hypothetical protein
MAEIDTGDRQKREPKLLGTELTTIQSLRKTVRLLSISQAIKAWLLTGIYLQSLTKSLKCLVIQEICPLRLHPRHPRVTLTDTPKVQSENLSVPQSTD